jgi:hypothetical protein
MTPERRATLLTLAAAMDAAGVPAPYLAPEAFPRESDRRLWREIIAAWGQRVRGEAA